jgi:GntR family transcriptional regulator
MADRAPFRQIADQLRSEIVAGRFTPGAQLPAERQLAETYQVHRATVRRAIMELKSEGLVESAQGRGNLVRNREPVRRVSWGRAIPAARSHGDALPDMAPASRYGAFEECDYRPSLLTAVRRENAPEQVARAMGVPPGERVLVRERHVGAPGRLIQLTTTYVSPAMLELMPQIEYEDVEPERVYAWMEGCGLRLRQQDAVTARMPRPDEARALRLGPGLPLLVIRRLTLDQRDRVLDVTDMRLAAEANELVYEV